MRSEMCDKCEHIDVCQLGRDMHITECSGKPWHPQTGDHTPKETEKKVFELSKPK